MKRCTKCGETKPLSEFYVHTKSKDCLRTDCKECNNTRKRAWELKDGVDVRKAKRKAYYEANKTEIIKQKSARHRENPGKRRDYVLRAKYSITLAEYNSMLTTQNGACKICKGDNNGEALLVDHDHLTGVVRGLLCGHCNIALGHIKDNETTAHAMHAYLSTNKTELANAISI